MASLVACCMLHAAYIVFGDGGPKRKEQLGMMLHRRGREPFTLQARTKATAGIRHPRSAVKW